MGVPAGASRVVTASLRACLVALLLALGSCGDAIPKLETGAVVPSFTLDDLAHRPVEFPAQARGEVVALRFWADWCPFCESEMTQLEPVYRKYRDRGLRILAVNVRQDPATAERFVRRLGVSYETLLDVDGRVSRRYGVIGLPTTFFIDREGRLRAKVLGESTPEVFERIVADLL
ncbi:MAG: TlpA family protein disulfide reductase [Gammaproteobacteria bacterium]|nr:TlpA family protein disulfide reductase [Gammaproteobacteria bacterium]